jgi:short-subunit dehydrogenase
MSKVILVTGGGSGMGQLAARNFAARGWKVAALDVNQVGLAETRKGNEAGIDVWTVDITDAQAVNTAIAEVETRLGPIHTVYNCAAIMPFGKLIEQDTAIQHRMMTINYGGLVNIARATMPRLVARRSGVFVSFASLAGVIPVLLTGAYSATKAAVATYTEVLHHENRDSGVHVCCVFPPIVNTPLLKQGRDSAWPKMLENQGEPIGPQEVLDRIDEGVARRQYAIYPGKQTRLGTLMRRLFPALVWKQVHQVEGW